MFKVSSSTYDSVVRLENGKYLRPTLVKFFKILQAVYEDHYYVVADGEEICSRKFKTREEAQGWLDNFMKIITKERK